MGIIVVTLLVTSMLGVLMFVGTFAILTVSPEELWHDPLTVLTTVGEMSEKTAQTHVGIFVTTAALLFLLALTVLVAHIIKKGDSIRKEHFKNLVVVSFYVVFLLFLGNGIFYVFNLFVKFNPSL